IPSGCAGKLVLVARSDREAAIDRLTDASPSFPNWREEPFFIDDDGSPLGHLVVVELCAYLLDLVEKGRMEELDSVLAEAERMIGGNDDYATDLACAGVVE